MYGEQCPPQESVCALSRSLCREVVARAPFFGDDPLCLGERRFHPLQRGILPDTVIIDRSSEATRDHQRSSEAIRSHWGSSEVIRCHQRLSEVIKGHQLSSEAIRRHQTPSGAIRFPSEPMVRLRVGTGVVQRRSAVGALRLPYLGALRLLLRRFESFI